MVRVGFGTFVLLFWLAASAAGQPLGTFRWQLQPYCNVVALDVTQIGAQYRLEGYDDQCGATPRAATTGLVVANPDGSLQFGLTIVTAAGPQHLTVLFSTATLGGTWQDSGGNSGAFVFNPGGVSGPPRPSGLGSVAINPAQVQTRVSGVCGTNQFVQGVNSDGTVNCASDAAGAGTITGVTAGAGLSGGGSTGTVTLDVAFAGPGAAATVARSDHTHAVGPISNTAVGNGALTSLTSGTNNTAVGRLALNQNTTGAGNAALGHSALFSNTIGADNVAVGYRSLQLNTTGNSNTALGSLALQVNATGASNVAAGRGALASNTTGGSNVAIGVNALIANTTADENTAVGTIALGANTTGAGNVAVGYASLNNNSTGLYNTSIGHLALGSNTTGEANVAIGRLALSDNQTGNNLVAVGQSALIAAVAGPNTAVGAHAAEALTTGTGNIAIGASAGIAHATETNNISIGHEGVAAESGTIRIGTEGTQTATYIAGIKDFLAPGQPVQIDSNGQLNGGPPSSRRFKQEIAPMGDVRSAVQALQPVTFFYKPEISTSRVKQYGLIAEQVDEVLPDMVIRNDKGEIQSVRYQFLAPLLLADVQRLERERSEQEQRLTRQEQQIAELRALVEALVQRR